jgi:hypothetical protein
MGVIDDVLREFDRRLGMLTGARRAAAQRQDCTDLDRLVL